MDWTTTLHRIGGVAVAGAGTLAGYLVPGLLQSSDPHTQLAGAILGAMISGGVLHAATPPGAPPAPPPTPSGVG